MSLIQIMYVAMEILVFTLGCGERRSSSIECKFLSKDDLLFTFVGIVLPFQSHLKYKINNYMN